MVYFDDIKKIIQTVTSEDQLKIFMEIFDGWIHGEDLWMTETDWSELRDTIAKKITELESKNEFRRDNPLVK